MAGDKYAVGERERRFLLGGLPSGITNPRRIVDRYLEGTRLRLRTVDGSDGTIERKLGHKRRLAPTDPTDLLHTSMYLDEAEFGVIAALPARRLTKTRGEVEIDGRRCAVDVFDESLRGLILLEVDLGELPLDAFDPPSWAGPDVTLEETFTGGGLAGRSIEELSTEVAAAWS